jgi:hypothetical protein
LSEERDNEGTEKTDHGSTGGSIHQDLLGVFMFRPARPPDTRDFRYGPISAPVTASTEQTVPSVSSFKACSPFPTD